MQVRAAALVGENFQKAGHAAGARVGKHNRFRRHHGSRGIGARRSGVVLVLRTREDAIDRVHQLDELGAFAVARMRDAHGKVRMNVSGVAAENDDAIGQDDSFLDVVGDDEDRACGNLAVEPEFEKLAAQSLRGEDVERGERFIHEEHFGLDDQCAGDTDALLHAAGEFLGVGGFETVEADGVDDAKGALVALHRRHAAGFERGFDIFENGQPGEEREALKDDGDVGGFALDGLAVPIDGAGGGRG